MWGNFESLLVKKENVCGNEISRGFEFTLKCNRRLKNSICKLLQRDKLSGSLWIYHYQSQYSSTAAQNSLMRAPPPADAPKLTNSLTFHSVWFIARNNNETKCFLQFLSPDAGGRKECEQLNSTSQGILHPPLCRSIPRDSFESIMKMPFRKTENLISSIVVFIATTWCREAKRRKTSFIDFLQKPK